MPDSIDTLAGTMPDTEVATRLGMPIAEVKAWRREHGVEPFRQPPPPKTEKPKATKPPEPPRSGGRSVVRRRGGVQQTVAREPAPVSTPNREVPERTTVAHRLDAVRDQLGRVSDDEVARLAGVSRSTVVNYRKARGIAPYSGYLFAPGHRPPGKTRTAKPSASAKAKPATPSKPTGAKPVVAGANLSPTTERSPRTSRIGQYRAMVGVEPDWVVAEAAGVSREAVQMFRRKHRIPAARPRDGGGAVGTGAGELAVGTGAVVRATGTKLRAYRLLVVGPDGELEFYAVGNDMADACAGALMGVGGLGAVPCEVVRAEYAGDVLG